MAIDKLNSLQFLLFSRTAYFHEFGDRDGVYVDLVPFELRQRLLRWTWPTTERDQYFFQHEGRDVITREGWEAFVRMKEGPSKVAVKLVLVDGVAPSDAALATGLSPQSVSNALRRCRTGLALAWIAAGVV